MLQRPTLCSIHSTALLFRPTPRKYKSGSPNPLSRSFYHSKPRRRLIRRATSTEIIRNGISVTSIIIISVSCLLGTLVFSWIPPSAKGTEAVITEFELPITAKAQSSMVTAILPGRPGNLTPDQEARLREFWTATLNVFGVVPRASLEQNSPGTPSQTSQRDRTETLESAKRKGKKSGLFHRSHKDKEHGESKDDGDDKYGQTKAFQEVIATQKPEDLRKAFWAMVKHDNPDGLLLRFLRARKWDVEKALVMLISTMHWRISEMHVDDDIMKNGESYAVANESSSDIAKRKEAKDFMTQLRMGKSFLHGTDKEGRPMCFVRVKLHKQGEQSEASLERTTVYIIESARFLLAPPVDTAAVVFDMTGFSMANMDYGPVKFMIKCFEANYPESLGVVLVHKSPWIFQGVWNIIKGWLDPVVAGKVHFTKNVKELEQFVPRSNIIKELGGDDPYMYEYIEPRAGEDAKMADDATRKRLLDERAVQVGDFEDATFKWIQDSQPATQQKRNELVAQLRTGYWQLDPYVRARTLYDRIGMVREEGVIQHSSAPSHIHSADDVD